MKVEDAAIVTLLLILGNATALLFLLWFFPNQNPFTQIPFWDIAFASGVAYGPTCFYISIRLGGKL